VRPYVDKTLHKTKGAGRVAQSLGPEFKVQYRQKKKRKKPGILCRNQFVGKAVDKRHTQKTTKELKIKTHR
jgi:hypothetical protein